MYNLLLRISNFHRWLVLLFVWVLFIALWYLFVFRHFTILINLSQFKVNNALLVLDKLRATTDPEILNACKVEEKDIDFLNSLIMDLIQEFKIGLSKCIVACEDGVCAQCLKFCVYGEFGKIKKFFNSIDALKLFKFCYCNLQMNSDSSITVDFAVKSCPGAVIINKKNDTENIENERNPFVENFNIDCIGLVSMDNNNFLLAKFENRIIKLGLNDTVDEYKLVSLNSSEVIFENIKSLKAIVKNI